MNLNRKAVSPAYDTAFYCARASRFAMLARLEPEPAIRQALEGLVHLCLERAAALTKENDVVWRED